MLYIETFLLPEELLRPSKASLNCPVTGIPLLGLPELLILTVYGNKLNNRFKKCINGTY